MKTNLLFYLFFILTAFLFSCNKQNSGMYNTKVFKKDSIVNPVNDTIVILFDCCYKNDIVELYVNNKLFQKKIITTSDITGCADLFITKKHQNINKLGIRINEGKLINFSIDYYYYVIARYKNDSLSIILQDKTPACE
jgi:hypothetical protein